VENFYFTSSGLQLDSDTFVCKSGRLFYVLVHFVRQTLNNSGRPDWLQMWSDRWLDVKPSPMTMPLSQADRK